MYDIFKLLLYTLFQHV